MHRKRTLNIFLSMSIVLQAALFQVALPNLVLCIGEEGHFAFEWQPEEDQRVHINTSNNPSLGFIGLNDHPEAQQDCTDIRLHFHPSQANKNQKQKSSSQTTLLVNELHSQVINKVNPSMGLISPSINSVNAVPGLQQNNILLI